MFRLLVELFKLLTPNQRKRLYMLQVLVIIMGFAEIVGVASIAPFMALVGDLSILEKDNFIASLYDISNQSPEDFIFSVGVFVLLILFFASIVSIFTVWCLAMFSAQVGVQIGDRLYSHYLSQSWLFHSSRSSAQLTKNVANESGRITNQIIRPLMQVNAKLSVVAFISIGLVIYDPVVSLAGLFIFLFSYFLLYSLIKKRVYKNGKDMSTIAALRYQLMNEGFGAIKEILLLGRQADFINRFNKSGQLLAYSSGNNSVIGQVPKYVMELLSFGAMIGMVLYLLAKHQGDLGLVLPIMSVYALAGFKLLPALQLIYNNITQIKGASSAFYAVREDLFESNKKSNSLQIKNIYTSVDFKKDIVLKNVTFQYPNKRKLALKKVDIKLRANTTIGIVGPSGSGKSTLIDILLALIVPQGGDFLVDGVLIDESKRRAWQNKIGFVPQSIFLTEGSIAENVALGVPKHEIDFKRVERALNLAHLSELVNTFDDGMEAKVGERGVQLSGGQRQRVGIARALYSEAEVLVFDEATSALDGISEKLIMDSIQEFSGKKTIIIIAHRLKTIQGCDQIYLLDAGKIVDQGTYNELIVNNEKFKKMASYS